MEMAVTDDTRQVEFAEQLAEALTESGADYIQVTSFEEAGMLTRDAGFTVRMADGATYQVIVKQVGPADGQEW